MNGVQTIKQSMSVPDFVAKAYLADLSDADLMLRVVPGINHIKWQLGHLIASEHKMLESMFPGSMPPLPAGFAEKHTKETSGNDNPAAFLSKDEYLKLFDTIRAATLAAVDRLTDADLDKPGPEFTREYCPTVASVLHLQPQHWLMHAGQWAVLRRKLGKAPLF